MDKFEGDGTLVEEAENLCLNALSLMTEHGEGIWCTKTCQLCYKELGEFCEDENPITTMP